MSSDPCAIVLPVQYTTPSKETDMSKVKTNLPGLIRGSKPQGAVGEALLAAAKKASR